MLGLHLDDNAPVYVWIVLAALLFFAFSAVACLVLIARRIIRNHQAERHDKLKAEFTDVVTQVFARKLTLEGVPDCRKFTPRIVSEVLLFYFRTLDFGYAQELRKFISEQKLERQLQKGLRGGTLGDRTRALQVLSYLESETSLQSLSEALHQRSVYVWLVAARGLARRKAYTYIPEIIAALEGAFARKSKLVKTVLISFGAGALRQIETVLNTTSDKMIMVACLEAAAHFDATSNRIDPALYLPHSDDNVRAAALILLAGKDGPSVMQYMDGDLAKESVTIRIRAAKLACKVKRPEFSMQLVDLLEDSHFWVRYWAARALYALGANGEDILSTMAKEGTVAGRMAGDVLLEMEAINA